MSNEMFIDYKSWYDADYWNTKKVYHTASGDQRLYHNPVHRGWQGFQYIADILLPIVPGIKTMLDVGCSGGDFASRMLAKGVDAYGVDISEYAVNDCEPPMKGRIGLCDVTDPPEKLAAFHKDKAHEFPNTFDLVVSYDFWEHIYLADRDKAMDWVTSKANNYMFFCIATAWYDKERFQHTKGEPIPREFEGVAVSGHVNVITPHEWRKYFASRGLIIDFQRQYLFQERREMVEPLRATMGWHMGSTFFLRKK